METTYVWHTIDKLKLIRQTLVLAYQNENSHRLIDGGITAAKSVVSLLSNGSGADRFQF